MTNILRRMFSRNVLLSVLLRSAFVLTLCLVAVPARAEVKLASVFGDRMVLQREMPVPIWGTASPNEEVTVEIAGVSAATRTKSSGSWSLRLAELPVGGPYTLTASGKNTVTVEEVLVGDVWLCSGQSNMQMRLKDTQNAEAQIAAANDPELRLLTVPLVSQAKPQYAMKGTWSLTMPETVPDFSAVAYYFGREMRRELGVPIGLIHASWGGSTCEAWMRPELLPEIPLLETLAELKRNEKLPPQQKTGGLYHGMILPIRPYALRGVLWYQGESNAGRAYQYRTLFPAMITHWREIWEQGDFPFYFVQLANYRAAKEEPEESAWAELREAQLMAESLRSVKGAITIDIGEADDIHPKNKREVGHRLALLALADEFHRDIVSEGPRLADMKIRENEAILTFTGIGGGLRSTAIAPENSPEKTAENAPESAAKNSAAKNSVAENSAAEESATEESAAEVTGFALAGADRKFHWATAKIDGDRVIVTCPEVPQPVAVRYGWADNPRCGLWNAEGLPAAPFRTDAWPGVGDYNR